VLGLREVSVGSTWFECEERGVDPEDALDRARDRAEREAGEEGVDWTYPGNVLAKSDLLFFRVPPGVTLEQYLESLDWHHPWNEKWGGVAGCVVLEEVPGGESLYRFFGVAPC
jgi:hypothetical protein